MEHAHHSMDLSMEVSQIYGKRKAPLVVYHLQKVPGNPVGNEVEHDFSGLSSWEFPRATERLER